LGKLPEPNWGAIVSSRAPMEKMRRRQIWEEAEEAILLVNGSFVGLKN
jgi:hypothetical protein